MSSPASSTIRRQGSGPSGGKECTVQTEGGHHQVNNPTDSSKHTLPAVVVYHDWFNLLSLFFLNTFNGYYLVTGRGFGSFYLATMLYFLADLIYVGLFPRCVKSPVVILAHHIISSLYILIPYSYPKYEWCMSYCMLVEVNTWFLIAKRTVSSTVLEVLFYVSWVLLRNIWYPYLIYVFYQEWQLETKQCGSPWNPILITPIFQVFLTGLNFQWSWSLFTKPVRMKQL